MRAHLRNIDRVLAGTCRLMSSLALRNLATVKGRKLKWYGHLTISDGLTKVILQRPIEGKRRRGAPKKMWADNIVKQVIRRDASNGTQPAGGWEVMRWWGSLSQLSTFMKAYREYAREEGVWDHCTLFSWKSTFNFLSLKMYYKTWHMSRIWAHLIFSIQIICVQQLSTLLILWLLLKKSTF